MQETNSLCKKVDQFIAPSKYLMNRFVDEFGIPVEKIQYLDYGFPLHYLTPNIARQERAEFTFGYIGTHIPAKGINQLIEAFKMVKGKVRLKIWGSKDQQSTKVLRTLALDSANPVDFMGEYVSSNLADEVFSQVDRIVVPSIWAENSPLVIHEAQACHVPVLRPIMEAWRSMFNMKSMGCFTSTAAFRTLCQKCNGHQIIRLRWFVLANEVISIMKMVLFRPLPNMCKNWCQSTKTY
ncbi:MAG: glycosyltransferase [Flavobacteriales bacterium]|nr:glycosyltransferase [Flavobacteriales bacterium]